MDIKQYKRREIETIPAIEVTKENIQHLNKFYQTEFNLGEYIILSDEREDTDKIKYRRACVWSKESFEKVFCLET